MFRSIRWRIAVPYLILILLTMIALGFIFSANLERLRLKDLEDKLLIEARLVGDAAAQLLMVGQDPEVFDALAKRWADLSPPSTTAPQHRQPTALQ